MASARLILPHNYPDKNNSEWSFFLQNLTNYITTNESEIEIVGSDITSISGYLLSEIQQNTSDINSLEITVAGHTILISNLNSSLNSLSNDLVSVSGNLQNQINNLDFVTDTQLAGISGTLQTNIDNLSIIVDNNLTTLVNTSGAIIDYVDTEIDELASVYTPLLATETIRLSHQAQIDTIETYIDGITGGLSQLDDRYVNISGDSMMGILTLAPSTSGYASLRITQGTKPTTTIDGDIWSESRGMFFQNNSNIHQMDADTNSVGAMSKTTITVDVSGTSISASPIDVFIYSNTNWTGDYSKYTVPMATNLSLTDNSVNYLIVDYNSGNPIFTTTTTPIDINGSNKVLAATLWREGTEVHWVAVDWGLSTGNRLNDRQINIQRYERSSGLTLSTSGSNIELTSGVIWYGVTANSKPVVSSNPNNCYFYYHTSSTTWTKELVSSWNNSYYDNGSSRHSLGNNNYVVNWVYRFIDGDNLPALAYILSTEYSNITNAKASTIPSSIPPILQRMGILVGRIITKQGTSTAIQTDSAFTTTFAGSTITDHNNLSDLQGGTIGEYYHHTASQYNDFIGRTDVEIISGSLYSTIANASGGCIIKTPTSSNNIIQPSTSTIIPLTIKGVSSQSANLQNWQNSDGTILASVCKDGCFTSSSISGTNGNIVTHDANGKLLDSGINISNINSFSQGIVLPALSGYGIKVDTTTPTFGYEDLIGEINIKGTGSNNPSWAVFRDTLYQYQFSNLIMNEVWNTYHIHHDYVPGTDMYIHVHWEQKTVDTGGTAGVPGVAKWYFDISYAKGYGTAGGTADPFPAIKTISVTQQASTTQYGHMIAEVQFTSDGGSATTIDRNLLEVDGIIKVRTYRDPADPADTLNQAPFVSYVDIHYQSTKLSTKNKNRPFYTG